MTTEPDVDPVETDLLTDDSDSPFMSALECAEYLRLGADGVQTLAAWRVAGGGKGPDYRKHGRRPVYHVADVLAWSEKQRRRSTSEEASA